MITGAGSALGPAAPREGRAGHETTLQNLMASMGVLSKTLASSLDQFKMLVNSSDPRTALDYLLAEQGHVCVVANSACHTRTGTTGPVEQDNKENTPTGQLVTRDR